MLASENYQGMFSLMEGHDGGHDGYGEHAVGVHLQAQDGDARDGRAVRCEDDMVHQDEKDGI